MLLKTVWFFATNEQAGGAEEQKPHDKKQHNNKDECGALHPRQGGWFGEQQAALRVTHPHGTCRLGCVSECLASTKRDPSTRYLCDCVRAVFSVEKRRLRKNLQGLAT